MKTKLAAGVLTLATAIPAFALSRVIWPDPPGAPGPPARLLRRSMAFAAILGVIATLGCTSSPQPQVFPAYNHTYGIATHNSYWMNRGDRADLFASGAQELVTDQLLHEQVRFLEIDAHSQGAPAHEWKVYHSSDSEDFSCRYLSDCVELLRNFHYAVPRHEVVNVMIELKNVVPVTGAYFPTIPVSTNFSGDPANYVDQIDNYRSHTDDHTMADFDAIFRHILGSTLYTPSDFLARCTSAQVGQPSGAPPRRNLTMRECAALHGWPTVDQLRGRFIINLLGNFSTAAYDWANYAGFNVGARVAFPMQTVLKYETRACTYQEEYPTSPIPVYYGPIANRVTVADGGVQACIRDVDDNPNDSPFIDLEVRRRAFAASVFWQLEDLSADGLMAARAFLSANGIIRASDSFEYGSGCSSNCQEDRIKAHFQMIQTDYPWHFVNNSARDTRGIPTDPSQRLRDEQSLPANGVVGQHWELHEPGSRLYFETGPDYPGIWVYRTVSATSQRWLETTVSSTRQGQTFGALTQYAYGIPTQVVDYMKGCGYVPAQPLPPFTEALQQYVVHGPLPCTDYPRTAQEFGEGCIKVASESEADWMEVCRQKNNPGGASYYQESVDIYVRAYANGVVLENREFRSPRYGPCKHADDPNSDDVFGACIGSLIAIAVKNFGQRSEVQVYSAGELQPQQWLPQWNLLDTGSFPAPMTKQGFRGWKSELLVGLRVADKLNPVYYTPPSPSPGVIGPPSGTRYVVPDPSSLHDISLEDILNREVAGNDHSSRVVNLSFT